MRTMRSLIFFLSVALSTFAVDLDKYILTEAPIAKTNLLANIGPNGSKAAGAYSGVVIASPSTVNPDYFYTWVRDSSLVFKELIDQYTQYIDITLGQQIDNFVGAEAIIQQIPNPSGNVSTGGLGEPKFNVNETEFTGSWCRPQRGERLFPMFRVLIRAQVMSFTRRWSRIAFYCTDHLCQLAT